MVALALILYSVTAGSVVALIVACARATTLRSGLLGVVLLVVAVVIVPSPVVVARRVGVGDASAWQWVALLLMVCVGAVVVFRLLLRAGVVDRIARWLS